MTSATSSPTPAQVAARVSSAVVADIPVTSTHQTDRRGPAAAEPISPAQAMRHP